MKSFKSYLEIQEGIRLSRTEYGTNAPDFNDGVIAVDSKQDLAMSFFGIKRDFHHTFFNHEDVSVMVAMGRREGVETYRLVFGISKKPTSNWKKYKYGKQSGVSFSASALYGKVGSVAVDMIDQLNADRIALNGYTPKLSRLFQKVFKSPDIAAEIERRGFNVSFKGEWIYLRR